MSSTRFSEFQIDMRDMDSLLPEVLEFHTAADSRSNQVSQAFYWTENGIDDLKEMLLIESVRSILDKRCSQVTWDDVIAWVRSDEAENPFSFVRCVTEVMNADPERYREAVFDLVRTRNPNMYHLIKLIN